jgi:hypothetical protein
MRFCAGQAKEEYVRPYLDRALTAIVRASRNGERSITLQSVWRWWKYPNEDAQECVKRKLRNEGYELEEHATYTQVSW